MEQAERNRRDNITRLLPSQSRQLLDIGCGPIGSDYPYAPYADRVTAVDWRIRKIPPVPANVELVEADVLDADLPAGHFDTIIAADVFEHIELEKERDFADMCFRLLAPGGLLLVSVPHRGTFARLDPYQFKPALQSALHLLGAYPRVHNGFCDIRKGHKHYTVAELVSRFSAFEVEEIRRWGYFFEPMLVLTSVAVRYRPSFPGRSFLQRQCACENRDYGERSYNMSVRFRKPASARSGDDPEHTPH